MLRININMIVRGYGWNTNLITDNLFIFLLITAGLFQFENTINHKKMKAFEFGTSFYVSRSTTND